MNNLSWKEFAKNISEYVGMEADEIHENTDLYSDLMMDSLGLFSLGIYLNGIYKLEVPLSSIATINNIGDMFQLLNNEGIPA